MSNVYDERDGLRYVLEERQNKKWHGDFPDIKTDYVQLYKQIEDYLNNEVHKETMEGSILSGDGLLTDHGKEHVDMVIQRTYLLLKEKVDKLNGFEIFILLLSIHFHDVGNIYGRDKHEEKIMDVMQKLVVLHPLQTPVQQIICDIAMAHGGDHNNSKDTIVTLLPIDHVEGIEIRPAILASILRYADELADDHTRAARFLYDADKVPPGNKIYHDYSKSLEPVAIGGDTVIFKFTIPYNLAVSKSTKMGKNNKIKKVYLYDEILARLCKTICELEYCRKYSQGFILINSVEAKISIYNSNKAVHPIFKESIKLRLSGYPDSKDISIEKLSENQIKMKKGMDLRKYILSQRGKKHE
ncbi:hypothetical protein FACS189491_02580 [Spirochaetia bacterium]|nr:hypothetical protein FACS189491_02580 [Spirochaetia bacterium]